MKLGDFTALAKEYKNRTGYSMTVLNVLGAYIGIQRENFLAADVGAGTGKLTENLVQMGLSGFAVEPNDAMREEGMLALANEKNFVWSTGTAEITGLPDNCVDWVLMGSSFHWADTNLALHEFHRILKPHGFFTAIWNPRNIGENPLHMEIENEIKRIVPELKRVSSGSSGNMVGVEEKLLSTDCFDDLFLLEANHDEVMSKERYLGAWRSVNDIQAQAGPARFQEIMTMIAAKIEALDTVIVPYTSRAFTVRSTKE